MDFELSTFSTFENFLGVENFPIEKGMLVVGGEKCMSFCRLPRGASSSLVRQRGGGRRTCENIRGGAVIPLDLRRSADIIAKLLCNNGRKPT